MSFVEPVTLRRGGLLLEPLALSHEEGLRQAAADGELWTLRVTSVPAPGDEPAYIHTALTTPDRVPFAVLDEASGLVLGSTTAGRWVRGSAYLA
mgnify:CR=1 FL=1